MAPLDRARAEIQAAGHRRARYDHLQALAATYRVELDAIPIDDELAVARAIARLEARGIRPDPHLINPPTADQILAGTTERHP